MINAINTTHTLPAVGSGTSATDAESGLDNTFMTLLMAELKTQDPISPVDPTQMVGQMVSLNQLNELIRIRQALTETITSASPSTNHSLPGADLNA